MPRALFLGLGLGLALGCSYFIDASPSVAPEACAALGGRIDDQGICELDCAGDPCSCPAGASCRINVMPPADGVESLQVDCRDAIDCRIRCLADGCDDTRILCGAGTCSVDCTSDEFSCQRMDLTCGSGPCTLDCGGNGSCIDSSVRCGSSSACSVDCQLDACGGLQLSCETSDSCFGVCDPGGNNTCNNASFRCQEAATCELDCGDRPVTQCS